MTRYVPIVLTVYIAFVFIQSLFFKFAGAPETVVIFSTLDQWASDTVGVGGLFNPGGIFSAHVIGSAELVASALLIAGLLPRFRLAGLAGSVLALGIISGAIVFHLFSPLGVVVGDEPIAAELGVASDGGLLFGMAVGVFLASLALTWLRRDAVPGVVTETVAIS
ncbi:MAG: hypothetical protein AAGF19_01475 [Pseudomonadota bacterium]